MAQQKVSFPEMINTAASNLWRFMLIGGVSAGKTTLLKALESKNPRLAAKTQMIDYAGWGIDTPGEFVEMGYMRRVLVSTSFDAQLLVAVQDATREDIVFPPNYFLMFPQHTIGVLTKIDHPDANIERGKDLLANAGVTGELFFVSALTGEGVAELRAYLLDASH